MSDEGGTAEERLTVVLAQQGDGTAFRSLVERYDRRLLYFLRRILGDSEECFDALQSVWLSVHRSLRKLAAPEAFRVWVYRIAHAEAVSHLRKRTRDPLADEGSALTETAESPTQDPHLDNAELVHAALDALSIDHRRVLTLHYLEEMGIDDIAAVLECPPGTVKSRLHYAKHALRRRIEELDHA